MYDYSTLNCLIHIANMFVCFTIGIICIVRLNTRVSRVNIRYRTKYIAVLVGSVASGLNSLFWSNYPDFGSLIFSCMILYLFIPKDLQGIDNE